MGALQLAELLRALARLGRSESSHATASRPGHRHPPRHHVHAFRTVLCRRETAPRFARVRACPGSRDPAASLRTDDGRGTGYCRQGDSCCVTAMMLPAIPGHKGSTGVELRNAISGLIADL